MSAFNRVKKILASEDVLLQYPDFSCPFDLTTDASSNALGAVLSQKNRPITMISRTLSRTEQNYATNERELLAIVWALKTLRHYLYGVKNIHIFTDHQPLIFSISDKNPNTKMKRWRAFVEEFAPTFHYKPGSENKVADALSRQFINNMSESIDTAHSEESLSNVVKTVKCPINQFKNQLILTKASYLNKVTKIIFQKHVRHTISFDSLENLFECLKTVINPNNTNAIHCDLPILCEIQNDLVSLFPGVKFLHTEIFVIDLINKTDQLETVIAEHNRAHRCLQENFKQISREYYFPNIKKMLKAIIANCKICLENKYQRKPVHLEIGKTPIPKMPGEILHMDIFFTDKQHFLTCMDKFSKYAIVKPIQSRSTLDIKEALLEILLIFKNTKTIVSDNEKAFHSMTIKTFLRDNFSIEQFFIPTLYSQSNGQVKRFHSTLMEIARCIKEQQQLSETIDLVLLATHKYNNTIHSITNAKPIDILHNSSNEDLEMIRERLCQEQGNVLGRRNKNNKMKTYEPGEKVFLKRNRRLGNKFNKIFVEKVVEKDLGSTVLIDGKIIHKSNLR